MNKLIHLLAISLRTALAQLSTADLTASKTPASSDAQYDESAEGCVCKMIELVGSSQTSWEKAVQNIAAIAAKIFRDMRIVGIADVKELDVRIDNGKICEYRAKVALLAACECKAKIVTQNQERMMTLSERPVQSVSCFFWHWIGQKLICQ